MASPPAALADPAGAFSVHVLGAVNLLAEVARRGGRERVVWVGSSEMYGGVLPEENPVRESVRLRPGTVYAASKAAADIAVRAVAAGQALDVVRVRPFNHTGPGQRRDFVCSDFASQVAEIAAGRRAPVVEVGNIDVERDFADVRDIVRGYVAALERGRAGEAYNLCSGQARSIRSILAELCAHAGVEPEIRVVPGRWRPAEVPAYWGSADKAALELGWRPEIPWSMTLSDLMAWVRAGHPDHDVL
jgi:GDP-4-dehydro-6-deoxy-D-mannose reductase